MGILIKMKYFISILLLTFILNDNVLAKTTPT